jgi:class 3 adenylate cyclase/tetratricopeptide (TPR) repeat protein
VKSPETAGAASSKVVPPPARSPRVYTPKHLADKILQSKSALEGERKQVTVLFADVKGSMELAEQLDPEEWHAILDRFFAILTDGVHRFEGTVNQYTGDGIMALFGAPIAHEDHAQRACYAALHLLEEVRAYSREVKRAHGLDFAVRIGLHSGDVVVGKIGDDLRMDYTAQGHTVGLAQRMESLAEANTCFVSAATAAFASGYFALDDLGPFRVKGVAEPVQVFVLRGLGASRTRFDIARARGLSRFVGRAADLRTLEEALEQAAAGNGQVVGVVAEAGTGKSRLCFEFLERCRARGIQVYEGRAVAHGRNIPFLPILEVFRAYFGITLQDDDRVMRQVIQSVSETQPTVTLIEDLHWLDAASGEFLAHMVDARADSRNLLLVNFRPEYHADWMQQSWYRQIPLTPLGREAIAELLADLLGKDPSIAGLAAIVHARTGGNPFFTEEVAQSLIESGHLAGTRGAYRLVTPIERLEVPATVQAVLAARIDRLAEREKRLLQVAAVIGKDFPEPLLAAVAELPAEELKAALAALRRAEFIHEQALYPVAEYAFKHPLTQEVALGSQLRERRRQVHAAVAGAIEQQDAEHLDERAALLAHHWEEAGEACSAARWHRRAAEWAGRNDPTQGMRHMRRVLALTEGLEASDERSALRLDACQSLLVQGGWRVGLSSEEVEQLFAEGRKLATQFADTNKAIGLYVGYAMVVGVGGDMRRCYEIAREAFDLIDAAVSPGPVAILLADMSYSSFCLGRIRNALEFAERIPSVVRGEPSAGIETVGYSALDFSFQWRAQLHAFLGCLDDARVLKREAIRGARSRDPGDVLIWSLGAAAEISDYAGDSAASPLAQEARRYALEAVDLAERKDSHFSRVYAYWRLGLAHMVHSDWRAAAEAMAGALALARQHRTGLEIESLMLADLSRAYLGTGDVARARAAAEQAIERAGAQGARYFECRGWLALAWALRAEQGASAGEEIERCLDRALELVNETEARAVEPQIIEERARLAQLRGDDATAAAERQRAHALYVAIGATGHAERLAKERDS